MKLKSRRLYSMNELCYDTISLMDNAGTMAAISYTSYISQKLEEKIPLAADCKICKDVNFGIFYWKLQWEM